MPGRANVQFDVGGVLDVDRLVVNQERLCAVWGEILSGSRIDRLDEQVLSVGVGARQAPGDAVALAEQDDRQPGYGCALDRDPAA